MIAKIYECGHWENKDQDEVPENCPFCGAKEKDSISKYSTVKVTCEGWDYK